MGDLSIAFSVWAAVVALVGAAIVWELSRLRADLKGLTGAVHKVIVMAERRFTTLETHMAIKYPDFRAGIHVE